MNQLFDDQKNQFNEPVNNQVSPQDYLPSKKMMSIIIGIIIIIIIIIFRNSIIGLFKKIGDIQLRQPGGIPTSVVTQGKTSVSFNINKDTDADGIPDWQEALLGTDSEVYTTLEEVPIEMRDVVNNSSGVLTTSDQLALAIYERARTNPIGDSYEENLQAATNKEILDLADSIDRQLTTYILEDLNVIVDNVTTENIQQYRNNMQSFIKKIDVVLLVKETYPALLNGKDTFSERGKFSSLVNEIIKIPVPFEYANNHLELTNALAHAYDVFKESNAVIEDPEIMRLTLLLVLQKNINLIERKSSDFSLMLNIQR